jgi:hypothetical protein
MKKAAGIGGLNNSESLFHKSIQAKSMHPSGAKAQFFLALDGMAKAMPLQITIYEVIK